MHAPGVHLGIDCNSDVGKPKAEKAGYLLLLELVLPKHKAKACFSFFTTPVFLKCPVTVRGNVALDFKGEGICFLFFLQICFSQTFFFGHAFQCYR